MKIIELFGGIGACSKALEKLNIDLEIVDYVEIDKYAVKSFNAIHNTNFLPQDIKLWDKDYKDIDLIMHGSPCQDFSLAGLNKGGDKNSGTRSSLMYETLRIVSKIKPKYVIWENVKNLLSPKHIHNFNNYLNEMSQIGYYNFYKVLNAKDYGIPQNRERVFTVSIRKDLNIAFEFPKPFELKLRLKDMLEDEVDEKYYLSQKQMEKIVAWKAHQKPFENVLGNNSISPTLTVRGAGEMHSGMVLICEKLDNTTNLQLLIKEKTKKGYALATDGDGVYINRPEQKRGVVQKGMIQTLKTSPDVGVVVEKDHLRIRKLTPKECWRLMGFDDLDFEKASKVNSNAKLYKQAGNPIVVNVLYYILENLLFKQSNENAVQLSIFDYI